MIKPRLFTPGPTDVPPEVLIEMARPMFHHRTERFRKMFREVTDGLKKLLKTDNDVLTIGGAGTAGMEAAIAGAVPRGRKVLIANGGKFGERCAKIARLHRLDVDELLLEWGTALQPQTVREKLASGDYGAVVTPHSETSTATACDLEAIGKVVAGTDAILVADCITSAGALPLRQDAWGVDVVIAGSQKAFMLPPGLAFVSLSEKAWRNVEAIDPPGFYLDLKAFRKFLADNDTPWTPAVSLIRGLSVALKMIHEIGIETVWARTAALARATRAAAEALGLKLLSKQPSDSVTAMLYPQGVDDGFRKRLQAKYGCSVAGGQEAYKGKMFRVSHMGFVEPLETIGLIAAIEYTLAELGAKLKLGVGRSSTSR